MDGTLLDTQAICIPAWEYAGRLQGIDGVGQSIYNVCGMNETGWTAYLKENYSQLDTVEFKKQVRSYIEKNGRVKFKSGAKELLDYLKGRCIKIGLASGSSRKSVNHHLTEVAVLDYFDATVAGHDVINGKPAPDIFLKTAELMGVKPQSCFVFEDSANGIRAGHSAGMKCIGVPDIIPFDSETKKLMFKEIENLKQAINLFKKYE